VEGELSDGLDSRARTGVCCGCAVFVRASWHLVQPKLAMWRGEEERGRSRLLFSSHLLPQSIMSDTRTTSETYNASDSDLTLGSNGYVPPTSAPSVVLTFPSLSDVLFKVHKANLSSSSTVFRDMFALPNSEEGEIEMEEDEEVLGKILAYCYPDDVPRFVVGSYGWLKVCRAMDKYQVRIRIRQESHSAEEAGRFDEDSRPLRQDSSESQHPICVLH
jgi:hypothetical protein